MKLKIIIKDVRCQYCDRSIEPIYDKNGDIWFECPTRREDPEKWDWEVHTFLLYDAEAKILY